MNGLEHILRQHHLDPRDLEESFSRSSGPGGQNVNKVNTAVILKHLPSGIAVRVQDSRSQTHNREIALRRLIHLLRDAQKKKALALKAAKEKKRRQNAKRPRAVKEKILKQKKIRSDLKKLRGKIKP